MATFFSHNVVETFDKAQHIIDFILKEEATPNGKTRAVAYINPTKHTGLKIGDFVGEDGAKVVFADPKKPTAAEMKTVFGISLSSVSKSNLFGGQLTNQGEAQIVILRPPVITLASPVLAFKSSFFEDYTPWGGATPSDLSKVPQTVLDWFETNKIEIVPCGV